MRKLLLSSILSLLLTKASAGTIFLVVDTSSSMQLEHIDLQFDSYSQVLRSMPSLRYYDIEVIIFDSLPKYVSTGSVESAAAVFDDLPRLPPENRGLTCLTNALTLVEAAIPTAKQPVIIDISGDGEANCESDKDLQVTLDRIADTGTRINTLYIDNNYQRSKPSEDSYAFYESLNRNNGFTIEAKSFMEFELALFEKLSLEVAQIQESTKQ